MKAIRSLFHKSGKKQAGSSLLEVLISVVVISIGLLGVAGLQLASMKNIQSSSERSMAVLLSYSIVERMRSNPNQMAEYQLANWTSEAPEGASTANNDLRAWFCELHGNTNPAHAQCIVRPPMLSDSAEAMINCGVDGCTVRIRWDDGRASQVGNDNWSDVTTWVQL